MSRPLTILMIAPTSFFGDYGGHIRMLEEILALQRLGHRVTLVTYYMGRDLPGIDIRRTAPLPYRADYEVGSSRHKFAFDAYLLPKVLREAQRIKPDIIHGHMHEGALIGWPAARLLRVPLVFDYQGSLTREMLDHGFLRPTGRREWAFMRLERFISNRPAAILTSSVRARDDLVGTFGVSADKIHPLPDCVDLGRFDPTQFTPAQKAQLRRDWNIPPDAPVVAYLGLLADYQGTHHLVEAAAILKRRGEKVHFLIMGYPNVEKYRTFAEQLDVADRITFTGRMNYDLAPIHLSLGAIAVSAKMSQTEGSGKVLNYMAMAQPVVAYNNRVHREYLGDLGVYAPSADVGALATAIRELLHDPERRRVLGAQLRERARARYDWSHAAQKIVATYRGLLGEMP
ncbi:MAG: glycosyltransferase family 4 protein [Anaerolineae bacterium]|nr:glycosyltransferase family 4 protein [Anaerolineae bacterium]